MKLLNNLVLLLLFLASSTYAETFVYITDQVDIPIRSEKLLGNNIIRLLPSGTKLILQQITEDGWTEVKYQDTIGWVSSRYLSNKIDFPAVAKAMGAEGFSVSKNDEFAKTFKEALNVDSPAVIEITLGENNLDPWADNN